MKKVLVKIITKKETPIQQTLECINAAMKQDYPNFSFLISMNDWFLSADKERNHRLNVIKHENYIRKMALMSDADYFLMLDSDVILPPKAISNLMLQMGKKKSTIPVTLPDGKVIPAGYENPEKHIMGGWFKVFDNKYNCARWVADNTLVQLQNIEQGVIRVDKIDFGCTLISREVYEKIEFREGNIVFNKNQGACICLMFSRDIQDLGYDLFMDSSVICKHKEWKEND